MAVAHHVLVECSGWAHGLLCFCNKEPYVYYTPVYSAPYLVPCTRARYSPPPAFAIGTRGALTEIPIPGG